MSDPVDEHIPKAFASLADVSVRELEATAEALERRRDCLGDFSGVFREVAWHREDGSDPRLARFHAREYVDRADEGYSGGSRRPRRPSGVMYATRCWRTEKSEKKSTELSPLGGFASCRSECPAGPDRVARRPKTRFPSLCR
jgi:hypothetical protein